MYADANRTITKVNPAFCDAFGYNESEVIGQSVRIIYSDSADFEEQGEIRFNPHTPADPASYAMNYRRATEVRIDYVQHALSAFIGYRRLAGNLTITT